MSNFTSRPVLRWAVPAAAAVAVVGAGVAAKTLAVAAEPDLPARTAAQLLVDLQTARLDGLSGTVVEHADLGLPAIPLLTGDQSAKLTSLVSGKHTLHVWYSGPDRARVSLLGTQGQSDIIHNGADTWIWDSQAKEAQHFKGSPDAAARPGATPLPSDLPKSPQEAADLALKAIDPTTRVATDPTAEVAGRPAYQLDLVPRDSRSRIGSVRIAIDGATHVPTRVQVFAKGASTPALQVGFTSFSTATPPASTFAFQPPPGATVKQGSATMRPQIGHATPATAPRVVGKGWTTVLVAHVGHTADGLAGMLRSLPTVSGAWGSGHLLEGSLFSAVLTGDGRLAVGAVSPKMLYHALAGGSR